MNINGSFASGRTLQCDLINVSLWGKKNSCGSFKGSVAAIAYKL
jgi:hypothetical protein